MGDLRRMDDTDFLHHVLSDGQWHRQMDVLAESGRVRGCGMTVHSRAATLRERGFVVVNRQHVENGRRVSEYRLLGAVREGEVAADGGSADSASPLGLPPTESGPLPSALEGSSEAGLVTPLKDPGQAQLLIWEAA